MMPSVSMNMPQTTETQIAVLQTRVQAIEDKIVDLKVDVKDVHDALDSHSNQHVSMMKEMQISSSNAHKALTEKISSLEKWRWMLMGAGIVMGLLGYDAIAKLLKF